MQPVDPIFEEFIPPQDRTAEIYRRVLHRNHGVAFRESMGLGFEPFRVRGGEAIRNLSGHGMHLAGLAPYERMTRRIKRCLPVIEDGDDETIVIDVINPEHNASRQHPMMRITGTALETEPGTEIVIANDADDVERCLVGHQNPLEYFLNRDASPRGHPYVFTCCTYLPEAIGRWGPGGWGRRRPRLEDLDPEEVGIDPDRWDMADIQRALLEADANDGVDYTRHIGAITSGTQHQASTRRMNLAKVGEKRAAISHGDDELAIEARNEIDNHADTCVAGSNFR